MSGLDVETLAYAMDNASMGPTHDFNVVMARSIAAEYDRLTPAHPVAAEIVQRHVEAPWPPYRGRNRAGTQCAFCNRTWPCDAARLLGSTPPDAADLARWIQEWAESQPAITIRPGVEPQVAWRALADELLRRWGR